MTTFIKDPASTLDFVFDWAPAGRDPWLSTGETITAHTVTVGDGMVLDSSTATANKVVAWLSGGTVGRSYPVTCQITTNQGRTDERTFSVVIRER